MRKFIFISILFLGLFFLPQVVSAVDISAPSGGSGSIPDSINNFYNIALVLGGMAAVAVIVVGGIMYATSEAIDKKNTGKELITSAIWGLVLLLGAFIILNTINPELTTLELPSEVGEGVGEFDEDYDYTIGGPDDPFSCESQPGLPACGSDEVAEDKDAGCCNEEPAEISVCTEEKIRACSSPFEGTRKVTPKWKIGCALSEKEITGTFWRHLYYKESEEMEGEYITRCIIYAYQEEGETDKHKTCEGWVIVREPLLFKACRY